MSPNTACIGSFNDKPQATAELAKHGRLRLVVKQLKATARELKEIVRETIL